MVPHRTYSRKTTTNKSTFFAAQSRSSNNKYRKLTNGVKVSTLDIAEAQSSDNSINVTVNDTFDRLQKGEKYQPVKLKERAKYFSSESDPSKLQVSYCTTIRSPIIQRRRKRKKVTAKKILISSSEGLREKRTFDSSVHYNLEIQKCNDKSVLRHYSTTISESKANVSYELIFKKSFCVRMLDAPKVCSTPISTTTVPLNATTEISPISTKSRKFRWEQKVSSQEIEKGRTGKKEEEFSRKSDLRMDEVERKAVDLKEESDSLSPFAGFADMEQSASVQRFYFSKSESYFPKMGGIENELKEVSPKKKEDCQSSKNVYITLRKRIVRTKPDLPEKKKELSVKNCFVDSINISNETDNAEVMNREKVALGNTEEFICTSKEEDNLPKIHKEALDKVDSVLSEKNNLRVDEEEREAAQITEGKESLSPFAGFSDAKQNSPIQSFYFSKTESYFAKMGEAYSELKDFCTSSPKKIEDHNSSKNVYITLRKRIVRTKKSHSKMEKKRSLPYASKNKSLEMENAKKISGAKLAADISKHPDNAENTSVKTENASLLLSLPENDTPAKTKDYVTSRKRRQSNRQEKSKLFMEPYVRLFTVGHKKQEELLTNLLRSRSNCTESFSLTDLALEKADCTRSQYNRCDDSGNSSALTINAGDKHDKKLMVNPVVYLTKAEADAVLWLEHKNREQSFSAKDNLKLKDGNIIPTDLPEQGMSVSLFSEYSGIKHSTPLKMQRDRKETLEKINDTPDMKNNVYGNVEGLVGAGNSCSDMFASYLADDSLQSEQKKEEDEKEELEIISISSYEEPHSSQPTKQPEVTENSVKNDDVFAVPSTIIPLPKRKSVNLKPGKLWRRSLSLFRQGIISNPSDERCIAQLGAACFCLKCRVRESSSRLSVHIVPAIKTEKLDAVSEQTAVANDALRDDQCRNIWISSMQNPYWSIHYPQARPNCSDFFCRG